MFALNKTTGVVLSAAILAAIALVALGAAKLPPPAVELDLAVNERFEFMPARLVCKAGAPVHLRVTHRMPARGPDLPHTTVLLRRGTDVDGFGNAVLGARAEDNYVPPAFRAQVLAASSLVHSGGQVQVDFQAPSVPGDYPIVCSFPGHCLLGMKAVLVVE